MDEQKPSIKLPPLIIIALAWLGLMALALIFARTFSPYAVTAVDLTHRLQPPVFFGGSALHLLGSDALGRDELSRLLASMRISFQIAIAATIISTVLGTTLGFIAANLRGTVEQLILVAIDFQASMPFLIVALAVLAFLGNSLPLFAGLMGLYGWERHARLTRGLALSAAQDGYVSAIRQLGASPWRIYLMHILPNIASPLIVSASLAFAEVVIMESGLSFLGVGVQSPATSLGSMVGAGREYIASAPWLVLVPSIAIVLTTLSISMIGDWLRDEMDPKLR